MSRSLLVLLGFAGLIPFTGLAAASWGLAVSWHALSVQAIELYAAVILSFLGGVHWGVAIASTGAGAHKRLLWGVTPALIAWVIVLIPWPIVSLTLLILLLLLSWKVDRAALVAVDSAHAYLGLRTPLTAVASLSLLAVLGSFIRVGI
jgi:hypothetical protein